MPRAKGGGGKSSPGEMSAAARAKSREEAERTSWGWVEHVNDVQKDVGERHIQLAYRLHYPTHVDPQCKKNCPKNPKCYCALGRAKWLAETARESSQKDSSSTAGKKTEVQDSDLEDSDDEDETCFERRKPGLPIGLKNLGNTCYVNSFLQIWFHNTQFRKALYSWDPEQDEEEKDNQTLYMNDHEYKPEGIIANLQALFAVMEFSNRKAVDPNDFITKLGLDPAVQQDAQEFCKLFQGVLESKLSSQINATVKGMIQTQFCGSYAYVTTCLKCKMESKRPASFYELDLTLQGNKTLFDCLDCFLKEEKLEGDNQYFCGSCGRKQDATRCVRLSSLPTVLNLQLNRFIFDMKTGRKKKLNSFVQFPEELDMSTYVGAPPGSHVYALKGVLMHVGADANHGHYIAHIQEPVNNKWYKFSDTLVEPLGKSDSITHLVGTEKDPMMPNGGKAVNGNAGNGNKKGGSKSSKVENGAGSKQVASKKSTKSNSAYMLVYAMKNSSNAATSPESKKSSKLNQIAQMLAEKKAISVQSDALSNKQLQQQQTRTKTRVLDTAQGLKADSLADVSNGSVSFPVSFPLRLRALVERDRARFQEQISENKIEKRENLNKKETLHARMRNFSIQMVVKDDSTTTAISPSRVSSRKSAAKSSSSPDKIPSGGVLSDEDELDEDFEFVPKGLLHKYLEDPANTSAMTETERIEYRCCHGKLNLDRLGDLKVVNSASADEMYSALASHSAEVSNSDNNNLSGSLSPSSFRGHTSKRDKWDRTVLCHTCVGNRCREMILTNRLASDNKLICELMKDWKQSTSEAAGEQLYWLGRSSWRKWKTIAKDNFARTIEAETRNFIKKEALNSPGKSPPLSPFLPKLNGQAMSDQPPNSAAAAVKCENSTSDVAPVGVAGSAPVSNNHEGEGGGAAKDKDPDHAFNEDIACCHGKLCPKTEKKRMTVPVVVWDMLKSHFPGCLEFPVTRSDSDSCEDCMDNAKNVAMVHEEKRELAAAQKNALSDILNERNRPSWSKVSLNRVYLIPRGFVKCLRSFVRNPLSQDQVLSIGNGTLLCQHGDLMYPPRLDTESDYESVVFMVYEEEWKELARMFKVDCEIQVRRHFEGPEVLTSEPSVCQNCVKERVKQEEDQRLTYSNEPVYVRRLMGSEREQMAMQMALIDDPSFDGGGGSGGGAIGGPNGEPHIKKPKTTHNTIPPELTRKSNRRQKVRGEKEFFVNSNMLLRDFKVKIMEVFKVPPFDQNLMVEGRYLTSDSNLQTLGQLRLLPKSLIYLRADEPTLGSAAAAASVSEAECWTSQDPEEGFKGTGLVGGF